MIFMKKKILLFAILSLFLMNSQAQQPFSGCWQLNFLKDWTPQKDVDAKFNRSTVKLQDRFQDNTIKANNYQFYDGQVAACLTMNPSCSQTPHRLQPYLLAISRLIDLVGRFSRRRYHYAPVCSCYRHCPY